MYTPDLAEFVRRAEQGNLVPVYREIVADLETPISAFLKLREGSDGYAFLLESVTGGENIARYSYLATAPYRLFRSKGRQVVTTTNGSEQSERLADGEELMAAYQYVPVPGWERFAGGAVGYIGYDTVRFFEDLPDENPDDLDLPDCFFLPDENPDDLDLPDCFFMFAETLVVFDHVLNRVRVLANAPIDGDPQVAYWQAVEKIEAVIEKLRQPVPRPTAPTIKGGIPDIVYDAR